MAQKLTKNRRPSSEKERRAIEILRVMAEHRGRAIDYALGDDKSEEAFISNLIFLTYGILLEGLDKPEEKHN